MAYDRVSTKYAVHVFIDGVWELSRLRGETDVMPTIHNFFSLPESERFGFVEYLQGWFCPVHGNCTYRDCRLILTRDERKDECPKCGCTIDGTGWCANYCLDSDPSRL